MPTAQDLPMTEASANLPVKGWWVTGLADGESSFVATLTYRSRETATGRSIRVADVSHRFSIALRADDNATIEKLFRYFGCGHVGDKKPPKDKPDANPQRMFRVDAKSDLLSTIVPHFERFPLQSKKAQDFAIWKEIIKFIDVELSGTKGWIRRFPEKLKQLEAMCQALSATRQFQPMDGIR